MSNLIFLVAFFVFPIVFGSSGYLSGSISWVQVPSNSDDFLVRFEISAAFTASYFDLSTLDIGSFITIPEVFFYPDSSDPLTRQNIVLEVLTLNLEDDWFVGRQYLDQVYGSSSLSGVVAKISGCCLSDSLRFDSRSDIEITSLVKLDSSSVSSSPKSAAFPLITLSVDKTASILIAAIPSSSGRVLRFESNSIAKFDGASFPEMTFSPTSGLISWTPDAVGKYPVSFRVEEHTSSPLSDTDDTNRMSYITVSFMIEVVDASFPRCKSFCENRGTPCLAGDCFNCIPVSNFDVAPYCDANSVPFISSVSVNNISQTISSVIGVDVSYDETFSVLIKFEDSDPEDSIILYHSGLPIGASLTQDALILGAATFSWTPSSSVNGPSIVCFSATDSLRNSADGQICLLLKFPESMITDVEPSGISSAIAGIPLQFTFKSASSSHTVSLRGPSEVNGTVTSSADFFEASVTPLKVGNYILFITADDTSISRSFPVVVSAGAVDATNSLVFDDSSIGLSGGFQGSSVFFFVQARDEEDNLVVDDLSSTLLLNIEGSSTNTDVSFISNGLHRLRYIVPSGSSSFSLQVLNSGIPLFEKNGLRAVNAKFGATLSANSSVTTGDDILISIQVDGSENPSIEWRVKIRDDIVLTTYEGSNRYTATYTPFNLESVSILKIKAFSPGLGVGDYVDFDYSTGTRFLEFSVEILSGEASLKSSQITRVSSVRANERTSFFVDLKDSFGFPIRNANSEYSIRYSIVGAGASYQDIGAVFSGENRFELIIVYSVAATYGIEIKLYRSSTFVGLIGEQIYPFTITPVEFSFSSATSIVNSIVAGEDGSAFLNLVDPFLNRRKSNGDYVRSSFGNKLGTIVAESTVAEDRFSNRHFFFFKSLQAGSLDLAISVFSREDESFREYRNETITVTASDVVSNNTVVSGSGKAGGTPGEKALLIIQARDVFENLLSTGDDHFFILHVSTPNVVSTNEGNDSDAFYFASYNQPTSSGFCDFTVANISEAASESQLVAGDGFWVVEYTVPVDAQTTYELEVFYVAEPLSEFSNVTAASVAQSDVSESVYSGTASVTSNGNGDGNNVDWGLVAGAAIGGSAALAALGYGGYRLHRYRPKFKEHQKRRIAAEQRLEEIGREVDIIPAHGYSQGSSTRPPPDVTQHTPQPELEQIIGDSGPEAAGERPVARKEFAPARPKAKSRHMLDDLSPE